VTAVRVEERGLRLVLGSPPPAARRGGRAFLRFRGGTIRIGRMTQTDADLTIADSDPRDAFDFYPDRMTHQLEAGYAKLDESGGLTMIIPDYADIP